jgi:hypothetical protein
LKAAAFYSSLCFVYGAEDPACCKLKQTTAAPESFMEFGEVFLRRRALLFSKFCGDAVNNGCHCSKPFSECLSRVKRLDSAASRLVYSSGWAYTNGECPILTQQLAFPIRGCYRIPDRDFFDACFALPPVECRRWDHPAEWSARIDWILLIRRAIRR